MRFCLIGPTYPYRGGIAHYTTLLTQQLRQEHETLLISFRRQYPGWLFPGQSDRDPSERPLRTEAEYLLDPLNPLTWRQTLQRIRQWQPDIVVMQWWHPFWAPAWTVLSRGIKRLPQQPALLFICHNVLPHEKGVWDKVALRLSLSAGDGFIVHSQPDEARLRQQFPQAAIEVTPLPTYGSLAQVDTAVLPLDRPTDRPLLGFFGFVRPYKGLDILLEALPDVLRQRPVHLLVAGEFWQGEKPYRDQISRLGLANNVTLINRYLPDEELTGYVNQVDVVVLPYRSATQSAIVQLAFGLGKPVITTNVGGLAEVVVDGRTGLVVPPENPVALAATINHFFREDLGPQLTKNIQIEASRFSWQQLITRLIDLALPGNLCLQP
jgi:glycosyltransferase involved in cell wall biosynthesis